MYSLDNAGVKLKYKLGDFVRLARNIGYLFNSHTYNGLHLFAFVFMLVLIVFTCTFNRYCALQLQYQFTVIRLRAKKICFYRLFISFAWYVETDISNQGKGKTNFEPAITLGSRT